MSLPAEESSDAVTRAGAGRAGMLRALLPAEECPDSSDEGSRRTTITFYLTQDLRNRARAAYRSTSFAEKDTSWSEMLTKALLTEVERRERDHNGGAEFSGGAEPLSPGRPIGF